MVVDLDGKVVDGNPMYVPSSETGMHLKVYKEEKILKLLSILMQCTVQQFHV